MVKNLDRWFLIVFLCTQIYFWSFSQHVKPELGIVPTIPSQKEVEALSLGDKQLYFRVLALNLQMAGDTFGRSTPLRDYDYPKLLEWFRLMDTLDWESNFIPSIAAYYYSRSQDVEDVHYVNEYLVEHSMRDPSKKWWWLSQGIYLANSVLNDKETALKMAQALTTVKADIPLWARQMEVFLREDLGELDKAQDIMCEIYRSAESIPERELDFMLHFFQYRLEVLDKKGNSDEAIEELAEYCVSRGLV